MKSLKTLLIIFITSITFILFFTGCTTGAFTTVDSNVKKPNIESFVSDEGSISVHFCPEKCEEEFIKFLNSAQNSIHCALFEVSLESVKEKLISKAKEIEVKIIIDNQYLNRFNQPFVKTDTWGLQHNKFCIIDGEKVSTGSMNPTNNGVNKNNNNLIFVESKIIANNYQDEFQEMWNGTFKKGKTIKNPKVNFQNRNNEQKDKIQLEVVFCPEDYCSHTIQEKLKNVNQEIYFATFSFTNEQIANILLLKRMDGIKIKGIMEARQVTKYSQFMRLDHSGIKVIKDKNKGNMHHKFFVLDNKTVITGSFNPSSGGDKRNDENIVIIKNKEIAKQFLAEFEKLYTNYSASTTASSATGS